MDAATLADVFFPVYFALATGYIFARRGLATPATLTGATNFVFWVSLPALVFHSLRTSSLPVAQAGLLLVAYFIVAVGVFLAAYPLARRLGLNGTDATIVAMGGNYSNTILVGLPIISHLMGKGGVATLFWIVTFHAAILFTLAASSLRLGGVSTGPRGLLHMLKRSIGENPIILAVFAGTGSNLLNIPVPAFMDTALTMVGSASVPLGLFLVGVGLGGCKGLVMPGWTILVCLIKLVAMPALVAGLAGSLLGLPSDWVLAAVLTAGLPAGVTLVIFAERLTTTPGFASGIFFLSTVLSMVTIPGIVYLLA
jgi:predicted permease